MLRVKGENVGRARLRSALSLKVTHALYGLTPLSSESHTVNNKYWTNEWATFFLGGAIVRPDQITLVLFDSTWNISTNTAGTTSSNKQQKHCPLRG